MMSGFREVARDRSRHLGARKDALARQGVGVALESITSRLASVLTVGYPARSTVIMRSHAPPILKSTGRVYSPDCLVTG